ncbi:MAG TPA: LLM class flavin-dependent oxidoreductase [Gaiellaceae bacterium]|nr:LLM class flavin-dependent oxidoreductase [Gaiellaceae bacterium]
MKIGAERAGRDRRTLDIGAWCVITCGPDSEKAKTAARSIVAFYIPSMPEEQIRLQGLDPAEMNEIVAALGKGQLDKAYELTTPEIAETLSIAGTPDECAARIKAIEEAGVNHMICCITDPYILKAFTGKDVDVPDVQSQLRLIAEEVIAAFAPASAA